MPAALTYGSGKEGNSFGFFPIIVDGQVPDARVHVLNKACVMCSDWYETPLQSCRPLQTVNILGQEPPPIQQFYKVKLQTESENKLMDGPQKCH